jgi:hypothetical protein
MIRIRIGDQYLEGIEDNIQFEWNHPFFDSEVIPGSISYAFNIPQTPQNNILLQHANRLNIEKKLHRIDAVVSVGSMVFMGDLILHKIDKQYRCNFVMNGFATASGNKRIKNFALSGTINMGANAVAISTYSQSRYKSAGYCFPQVKAPDWYSQNEWWDGYINHKGSTPSQFVNAVLSGVTKNRFAVVPMVYLAWLIKKILTLEGYAVKGDFFDDNVINDAVLFCNKSMDAIDPTTGNLGTCNRVASVSFSAGAGNKVLFGTVSGMVNDTFTLADSSGTMSYYPLTDPSTYEIKLTATYKVNPVSGGVLSYGARFILFHFKNGVYDVAHVWEAANIVEDLFYTTTFEPVKQTMAAVGINELFFIKMESYYLDKNTSAETPNGGSWSDISWSVFDVALAELNVYKNTFTLQEIVPDETVATILRGAKKLFGLLIDFNNNSKTVVINQFDNVLRSNQIEDWTEWVQEHAETELSEEGSIAFKWNANDMEWDMKLPSVIKGELTPELTPLPTDHFTNVFLGDGAGGDYLPYTDAKANTPLYDGKENKTPLRVLWPVTFNERPLRLSWNSAFSAPNGTLKKRQYGLSEKLLASNELVTKWFKLPEYVLQNWTWEKQIIVHHRVYVVKQMSFGYTGNGLTSIQTKLIPNE